MGLFRKAMFLDKDDTLVPDVPYRADPERTVLLPGVAEGLRLLHEAGYLLIVVTNQPGVALGSYTLVDVLAVERALRSQFVIAGVPLAGYYYCPHHPRGFVPEFAIKCDCRKPKPGMLRRAAQELCIDLEQSWMIGDKQDDVLAGESAGCSAIRLGSRSFLLCTSDLVAKESA
jgi:D,D-heptose 1,7-bisphosphate phosphatase